MKPKLIFCVLVGLINICLLSACAEISAQAQTQLQESLEPFLKAVEVDNLNDMILKIYSIDSSVLTRPHSASELIERAKKNEDIYNEVVIDNATLKEHIATLSLVRAENFEVADGSTYEDATICFIFETDEKLLEIVVGGTSKTPYMFEGVETTLTVFINGVEVKVNSTLDQVLSFLYSLNKTGGGLCGRRGTVCIISKAVLRI